MSVVKGVQVTLGVIAGLAAAALVAAQPAPFNTFLLPPTNTIDIGDTAFVRFEVDASAQQFNAYEITILYDPDIINFLPPVVEGPLMTNACGYTFRFLTETDSTLTYGHSLLCAGISLNGPGLLSTYAFAGLANGTSPVTIISNPDRCFGDAGLYVGPNHPTFPRQVFLHNAEIHVGPQAGLDSGAAPPLELRLEQNIPNPFRAATTFGFELGAAGPVTLEVFDVAGRRVWADARVLTPGRHAISWRGFDSDLSPLSSGTYFYRLTTPEGTASRKLSLVR